MDTQTFVALQTPTGQQAIAAAEALQPTETSFLAVFTRLQKHYPRELARAALETAIWRQKATAKFSRAARMYFTRAGLEMASSEVIANHRARRYAGLGRVADLGCGIGGDLLGLAQVVAQPLGVDRERLLLAIAQANLRAYKLRADLLAADLNQWALPPLDGAFFDPARRSEGRRIFSVEHYQPPLSIIRGWLPTVPALGVKVSPGVKLDELAGYDCEIEFISLGGDLKEAALWFGPLRGAAGRRATLLPGGDTLTGSGPGEVSIPLAEPGPVLYEPDPAVIRAGLVEHLAARLGASMIDPTIAYLTADTLRPTPFARAFSIEAAMPFSLKRVRAALRERGVGRVTVKKRGSPLEVDAFARALKLKGDPAVERVVFLTRVMGAHWVLFGEAAQISPDIPQKIG